jgi:hypothetical protein
MKKKKRNNKSIVFRPGLVKDPDFDRVARVNFFLNQNDVVLVKKKINRLQPGF